MIIIIISFEVVRIAQRALSEKIIIIIINSIIESILAQVVT